jgi:hypothetical protein
MEQMNTQIDFKKANASSTNPRLCLQTNLGTIFHMAKSATTVMEAHAFGQMWLSNQV